MSSPDHLTSKSIKVSLEDYKQILKVMVNSCGYWF